MCVVIDTCALHKVFSGTDANFEPIKRWIISGRGKVVIGGAVYSRELKSAARYLRVLNELERIGKVVVLNGDEVDAVEARVRAIEPAQDFDDPHIVAIVEVSRCKIVCTVDTRSDRFLRDARFYVRARRPSIYRTAAHAHMIRDSNIVGACSC